MTYAVTGATGAFGTLAIQHLLAMKVPAASVVAVVRNPGKAAALAAAGVALRTADYADRPALEAALRGVDRLLLVSSSELGQRAAQHRNVIEAARSAGVGLIVYTSLSHADRSANPLAAEHLASEQALRASGVPFVVLRNNWYTENHAEDVRRARETGVIAAAVGTGRIASASRSDYAEAAARVLAGEGHAGKTYELSGPAAWDFAELARTAGELLGRPVAFRNLSPAERKAGLVAAGLPEPVADFVTGLDGGIASGSLAETGPDLERLLGRRPKDLREGLAAILG